MKPASGYDLRALEIFGAVSELRSMTLAAQRLNMTQPAVSQAVQQLEETLGVVLIDRSRRPLLVTAAGEWLGRTAARILNEAHQVGITIRQLADGSALQLRVGLVESLSAPFVPALVRRLKSSIHTLSISSGLARTLRTGLVEHTLDLIITNEQMDDVDGIERQVILTEPYLLALPRTMAAETADLAHLGATMALIRWAARSHIGADIERQLRRMRLDIPRQFEFDSARTILGMVAADLGWAIMTPLSIFEMKPLLADVRLLPFPGPNFSRQLAIVVRRGEFGALVPQIAQASSAILRDLYLPEVLTSLPWLSPSQFRVEDGP